MRPAFASFAWRSALAVLCAFFLLESAARASDAADEADLEFRIGADAYQKGDYRGALEHFLLSNRFVPNQ